MITVGVTVSSALVKCFYLRAVYDKWLFPPRFVKRKVYLKKLRPLGKEKCFAHSKDKEVIKRKSLENVNTNMDKFKNI